MSRAGNSSWIDTLDLKRTRMAEIELGEPLPEITPVGAKDEDAYRRALILVRLHDCPLGLLDLDLSTGALSPAYLAKQVWLSFSARINRHLQEDALPPCQDLSSQGIEVPKPPKCFAERQEMLSNAPLASIIMATRDRVGSLASTLNSVQALAYPRIELILVDNAPSSNATRDFFDQYQANHPRNNLAMRYVREEVPGLAVAHNRGLEFARGSIVAFTDDDVRVDKNWLTEIVRGFASSPDIGCVTGLVVPSELETPAQLLFEEFGGFTKGFDPTTYDLSAHRPSSPLFPYAAGRFGTGANMAFRTDLLQQAGGFDPALGIGTPALGADDMAAFFTVIKHCQQLLYQPTALIYHQHRRTAESLRKQMYGYGVGLTAFLTKCLLDDPMCFADLVSRAPAGVRYAFDRHSAKNQRKSAQYPRELEAIERKGMLYGPVAYLRSWWQYRTMRRPYLGQARSDAPLASQHYQAKCS